MHGGYRTAIVAAILLMLSVGCSTTGSSGSQNTLYATYRYAQNLDKNLSPSIDKLNVTSAELSARLDESNQQLRNLESLLEENQNKLGQLQTKLDELAVTLYRQFNLSPPSTYPGDKQAEQKPDVNLEEETITVVPPVPVEAAPEQEVEPEPEPEAESEPVAVVEEPTVLPAEEESAPVEDLDITPVVQEAEPPVADTSSATDPLDDYQRARNSYAEEDYETALKQYETFLTDYPGSDLCAHAQFWKAQCYIKLEKYDLAVGEFQLLCDSYPDSQKIPTAMHNQAVAYIKLGQRDKAIELFKKLIDEYPMDAATEGAREKLKELNAN